MKTGSKRTGMEFGVLIAVCVLTFLVVSFLIGHGKDAAGDAAWIRSQSDAAGQIIAVYDKQIIYDQHTAFFLRIRDWEDLSEPERKAALTELAEMESALHGIAPPKNVLFRETEENIAGCYNHAEHTICVSVSLLYAENADQCMRTLLHEFHHYYAFTLCDLVSRSVGWDSPLTATELFDQVRLWKLNRKTYHTPEESDFETYQAQPLEADARAFAEGELARLKQMCWKYE